MSTPASRSWAYGSSGQLRLVWRVLVFAGVLALAQGIITSIAEPVLSFAGTHSGGLLSPAELTTALYTLVAVGIVLRQVDGQAWASVGLNSGAWKLVTVARGAALGSAAVSVTCLLLFATGTMQFERDTTSAFLGGDVTGHSPAAAWLLSTARISLLLMPAAFYEELIFRGYLWRVLEDSANTTVALVASSILFALAHIQNPGADPLAILNVALAGLALGIVRQLTGSLPAAWAAHFLWNWIMAAVVHVQVSGLPLATPGYRAVMQNPALVSGGDWGPEGGLIATAVLLVLVVFGVRSASWLKQTSHSTRIASGISLAEQPDSGS